MPHTFFFLFLLLLLLVVLIGAEGAVGQAVDTDDLLIGVLEDEVLALLQLHADVDDAAQDAPGILHAQVDLTGELVGLELLGTQDDVARRVFHVVPGHITAGGRSVRVGPAGTDHVALGHITGGRWVAVSWWGLAGTDRVALGHVTTGGRSVRVGPAGTETQLCLGLSYQLNGGLVLVPRKGRKRQPWSPNAKTPPFRR